MKTTPLSKWGNQPHQEYLRRIVDQQFTWELKRLSWINNSKNIESRNSFFLHSTKFQSTSRRCFLAFIFIVLFALSFSLFAFLQKFLFLFFFSFIRIIYASNVIARRGVRPTAIVPTICADWSFTETARVRGIIPAICAAGFCVQPPFISITPTIWCCYCWRFTFYIFFGFSSANFILSLFLMKKKDEN